MKCGRCSAEIPAQSQRCLRCGTPVRGMTVPGTNRSPLLIVAWLLIALLGIGVLLIQKANKGNAGKIVAAATPNPAPVVQQPNTTLASPVDIDHYLKFLKHIEAKKQALIHSQTAGVLEMMIRAKPLSATLKEKGHTRAFKHTNAMLQKNFQDWNGLNQEFNSRKPPSACVDLRNKYKDQLGNIQANLFAITAALTDVETDPSSVLHTLKGMQGTSANVDSSIDAADSALAKVCDKYHLKKDFDIGGDYGGSSLSPSS